MGLPFGFIQNVKSLISPPFGSWGKAIDELSGMFQILLNRFRPWNPQICAAKHWIPPQRNRTWPKSGHEIQ